MARTAGRSACFFFPSLGGGGIEITMLRIAGAFADRGWKTDAVVAKASGAHAARVPSGVRLVDLAEGRMVRAGPGFYRYLRSTRPDVVIAAPDHTSALAAAARRLARSNARLIATVHNHISERTAHGGPKLRLQAAVARVALPRVDAVVAVSRGVADDLAANHGVPRRLLRVVYNPIPFDEIAAAARAPVDHPWLVPGQPPVILAVGRLAEQKDYRTLLAAFATVRSNRPVRLVLLGEGPERPALLSLAGRLGVAAEVDMPGFVVNPHAFMARAAVFALTSVYEGLGLVVAEALACGVPVVATDCPSGPAEILEGGRHGRLVPVGDATALAKALDAALDGPRPSAAEAALDRFRLDVATAGYLAAAVP